MKQINSWVDEDLAKRIEKAAAEDARSVSSWVRLVLFRALETRTTAQTDVKEGASA